MQNSVLFQRQQRFLKQLHKPFLSTDQRFQIYQRAYKQRIEDSLAEDFPLMHKNLGADLFSQLVQDYIAEFPSSFWSLGEVGFHLSRFISQSHWVEKCNYLFCLSQFEWLKVLANYAPIEDPFDFSSLGELEEAQWQKVILKIDEGVSFFQSPWAFHGEEFLKAPTNYLIYQKEGEVLHIILSQTQWNLVLKIAQGNSIEGLLSAFPDIQEQELTNLFSRLVSEKIISHFTLSLE